MGKASCSRNLREWSFLRCREGWRGLAFRQKAARRLLCWNLWWNVARPPADRLIASVHAAAGIVRRPAGLLLKQANRPDPTVAAEIKPVERPAGHAYQVASFHLNRHHRSLRRMNVEQPASGDDVTHFVFIMGVFDVELRQHGIEPGSVSVHVNHIRRDIPAPALAFFKLRSVCAQHLRRRSILRQIRRSLPALVFDADSCEVIPYLIVFEKRPLFVRNSQQSHRDLLLPVASSPHALCAAPDRTRTSIRNSRISTWRLASAKLSPQVSSPCACKRNPCMPGVSRSVLVTRSASSTTSREFSRIGSHSRCLWVSTAAKPFSISYPSSAMPPCRACVPESTVLHTERVWSTAPRSTLRTIARCSRASAEGRPSPRTTFAVSS